MDKEQAYKIGLAFKLGMIYARGKAHARKLTNDDAKWITVHPNGKENTGRPALLDSETGEVLGGMGGKFNGKHISAVPQHGKNEQMGAQMRVNAKSHKADLMNGQKIDFIKNKQLENNQPAENTTKVEISDPNSKKIMERLEKYKNDTFEDQRQIRNRFMLMTATPNNGTTLNIGGEKFTAERKYPGEIAKWTDSNGKEYDRNELFDKYKKAKGIKDIKQDQSDKIPNLLNNYKKALSDEWNAEEWDQNQTNSKRVLKEAGKQLEDTLQKGQTIKVGDSTITRTENGFIDSSNPNWTISGEQVIERASRYDPSFNDYKNISAKNNIYQLDPNKTYTSEDIRNAKTAEERNAIRERIGEQRKDRKVASAQNKLNSAQISANNAWENWENSRSGHVFGEPIHLENAKGRAKYKRSQKALERIDNNMQKLNEAKENLKRAEYSDNNYKVFNRSKNAELDLNDRLSGYNDQYTAIKEFEKQSKDLTHPRKRFELANKLGVDPSYLTDNGTVNAYKRQTLLRQRRSDNKRLNTIQTKNQNQANFEKGISKAIENGSVSTVLNVPNAGSWNKKIYNYRNGEKAVFINNQKIVLNDEQYKKLKEFAGK